ncbi:MAG: hypothetical protein ACFFAO_16810 [Candidatus Hermodarchaeota archaeon]
MDEKHPYFDVPSFTRKMSKMGDSWIITIPIEKIKSGEMDPKYWYTFYAVKQNKINEKK